MTRRHAAALIAVGLTATLPAVSAGQPVSGTTIWTIAGSGPTHLDGGFFGDGGPARAAELLEPTGVALDRPGDLYIADAFNERIRRVSPTGTITTIAGDGQSGFSGDGGPAVQARFDSPISVAVDAGGGVLVADQNNNRVRRIDPSGTITTIAGDGVKGFAGDGGPATSAELSAPVGVAVDARGGLLIADQDNNRVRRVDGSGAITTIAGDGAPAFAGDGGPATSASLHGPTGVAADPHGGVLIADAGNNRVRRIDPSGTIATIAGDGTAGFAGDNGPAVAARLNTPTGVTPDASGGILIADFDNDRVPPSIPPARSRRSPATASPVSPETAAPRPTQASTPP
jgi:sugar lactone lactonase YvrE